MPPDYDQLMRMNGELRSALADLGTKYQHLRTIELAQSWIIGAMSGALIVFGLVLLLQL